MSDPIYALGIDPGMASVGIAVVDVRTMRLVHASVIRTQKANKKQRVRAADDTFERARTIAGALIGACFDYNVKLICAESMSFPRSSSVAAKMAMCWGALAAIVEDQGLPLLQATPQEIKQALTGKKTASKEEVEEAVLARVGLHAAAESGLSTVLKSQKEHAFDAVAAVFACSESETFRMAQTLGKRGAA